ncbi:MAG: alkane 1-monooxygenase [Saprospiraceae bacterium]|nr:alkane 1-monooxygenase [Saprospiraceae bacterium]MBK6565703.1 alkane 1-monooxygenase [Saprospiraceae bacterium]MBK8370284.1 alkane 1-monooxygenase [Saprospiraceae bacterium]MBK8546705.1 alkane 1-monooxygenase [Saprospiraceae bacterium]MBK8817826.1 alkane 1-monooxygenase [Saprospiraceae bacterium]
MVARDLKYFLAYLIPFSCFIGIYEGGYYTFLTVFLTFVLIPLLELFTPQWTDNFSKEKQINRNTLIFFDILLGLNVVFVYGILYYFLTSLSHGDLLWFELVGITVGTGIVLGSNGINVAHELGHKKGIVPQILAKILLWPTLYSHFTTEHNYGHHARVGTPEDPATSRYNESVYFFWFRSICHGFLSAWHIRKAESKNYKKLKGILYHPFFEFVLLPLLYLCIIWYYYGLFIVCIGFVVSLISILLLETINYIEHYGLLRQKAKTGRYLPVESFHSWNSNHEIGRVVLYELTRHSDHHYKAFKKYQNLDHHDKSPQLPYGYPTSILLALFPLVWFKIMNPLVNQWKIKNLV